MKKSLLSGVVSLGLVVLLLVATGTADAQNNVTFRVNMKVKLLQGNFDPGAGHKVFVAGDMNGWAATSDTLTLTVGDSIYAKTLSLPTGAINYKFTKTTGTGIDWEGDPNRTYTVVAGSQTLPVVYFNRESVFTTSVNVTFRVNMRVKILETTFQPGLGDKVYFAGSPNGWSTSADSLTKGAAPNDSIYSKTLSIPVGTNVSYKFYKTPRGGLDWENVPNREYTVPPGGGTLPTVFFDNDSVVNVPINANILFRTDLLAYQQLGWFNAAVDSVQVRGGFNGWGGTAMALDPFTTAVFEKVIPYSGTSQDNIAYKFFIKHDSATAVVRFPGYNDDKDNVNYDHPYSRGDGNRQFIIPGGGNQSPPVYWFSDIHPNGLMNNTTDSVNVTLRVNMGPATRYIDPFAHGADTLRVRFFDYIWYTTQVKNHGTFLREVTMTRNGPTDSVYSATFKVKGKTHYGLMYFYKYYHPGGQVVEEGGGLGAQNPYRVRFIQPLAPNSFPANYTAPVDNWQKASPMPAETAPYNILNAVRDDEVAGVPEVYTLSQNYPNPFNPATRIKYSIPKDSRVTLKVFNILGQQVASLVDEVQSAGSYVALFEAPQFASGVYFYRLEAGSFKETKKMLLLK